MTISEILANPIVRYAILAIVIYVLVLWLAATWWVFADAATRTRNRVLPHVAAVFVFLFGPLLFPAGILLYRLLRPGECYSTRIARAFALKALAMDAANGVCPGCVEPIERDWLLCPRCRVPLRRSCPNCGRALSFDWAVCAWCGSAAVRPDKS